MKYIKHSHRYADIIFEIDPVLKNQWNSVKKVLDEITDEDIIAEFMSQNRDAKSISEALNTVIRQRMVDAKWKSESYIFSDPKYQKSKGKEKGLWRLDFAKEDGISVEVAFNHRSDCSWNLIKPVLASELNHVAKAIQTKAGIIICATDEMKIAGGFDSAVGTYETYLTYLDPMRNILTAPLLIIGLKAPETFKIQQRKIAPNKTVGDILMLESGEILKKH
ncbi:MAG: hypothetical protein J6N95_03290 [Bacilli bacterium]|nr:hypothetical protein [Bacilli bacterium]